MTPNSEDNLQKVKEYASKEPLSDQIYELEGLRGVHHDDEVNDSHANANANRGGISTMGMGDSSGGLSSGMGGETVENSSEGLVSTENETVPLMGGGLSTAKAEDNSGENSKSELNEVEKNTENATLSNQSSAPDEAGSSLNSLISEIKAAETAETNPEEGATTMGAGLSAGSGSVPSASSNETQKQGSENSPTQSTAAADNASKDILALQPTVAEDPNAATLSAAFMEGKNAGIEAGCSLAMGKKVTKSEGGFAVGESLSADPTIQKEYSDSIKNRLLALPCEGISDAALIQRIREQREKGFLSGFNHGYILGQQMKVDMKKTALHNDQSYQDGLAAGENAGTLSGSGDEAGANALRQEAQSPDKSENYRTGFNSGFNKKYTEARQAKVAQSHPSADQLMADSPNFARGYSWGEQCGMQSAKNEISQDDLKRLSALANQNKDAEGNLVIKEGENNQSTPDPLFKKGFFAGLNKGYSNGRMVAAAEVKRKNAGPQQGEENYIHFLAGRFKGGLAAFLGDEMALAALKDRNFDLSSLGTSMEQIPAEVHDYFLSTNYTNIYISSGIPNPEIEANKEKVKVFEKGYFKQFNKEYVKKQQNTVNAKKTAREGNPDYQAGQEIGRTAGQALAIKERLIKKVSTLSDENKIAEIETKIDSIAANLERIETNIGAANESYKKGYFSTFSLAYQIEVASAVQARSEARKNKAAQGAASGSDYGRGYETGTSFGESVAQKLASRPSPIERAQLNSNILSAMNIAKTQGEEYSSGFINAFNSAVIRGAAAPAAALDQESKTNKDAFLAELKTRGKNEKHKAIFQRYFQQGKEAAFDLIYNAAKSATDIDADAKVNKLSEGMKDEIMEFADANNKEIDDEERLPADFKNPTQAEKLVNEFKAGNTHGKKMGNQAADRFSLGLQQGTSGEKAVDTDFYYNEGYKAGQAQSEYQNLRTAAMAAAGMSSNDSIISNHEQELGDLGPSAVAALMRAFKEGYKTDQNAWLKIFTLLKGQELSKDFASVEMNIIGLSEQEKPGSDILLAAKTKEKKNDAINKRANEKSAFLQGIADEQGMSKESLTQQFKQGYSAGIEKAKSSIDDKTNDDALFSIGIIHGLNKDGFLQLPENKSVAEAFLSKSKKSKEHLEAANLTEEVFEKKAKFKEGKIRGEQMLVQIQAGMSSLSDFSVEMQGPAYKEAYNKGYKEGENAGENAAKEILEGNPLPERPEIKNDLNDELNAAYEEGFKRSYQKAIEYWRGYNRAYNQVNNSNADDDFDNSVDADIQQRSSFQEGVREGRKQGMLDKAAGTVNNAKTALSTESLQMGNKIANLIDQYREGFLDSRADGIEAGYNEAFRMPETPEEGNNIAALKKQFALKAGSAVHEKIQKKIEKELEKAIVQNSSNRNLNTALNQILENLSKMKRPDEKMDLNKKFDLINKEADRIFIAENSLNDSDQRIIEQLNEFSVEYISEFRAGFFKGGEIGLQDGISIKELKQNIKPDEERKDAADDFFNSMHESMDNEGEAAFTDAFKEGVSSGLRLAKTNPDMQKSDLERMEYQGISNIRAALRKLISADYKLHRDTKVDSNDPSALGNHRNITLGFRKILSEFKDSTERAPADNESVKDFIEAEMKEIQKELENSFEDNSDENLIKYFADILGRLWSKFLKLYQKGYHNGFKSGVHQGVDKRNNAINSASAGADNQLQAIHELLQGSHIQDAYINDLDLADAQDEMRHELAHYRAEVNKSQEQSFKIDEDFTTLSTEYNQIKSLESGEPEAENIDFTSLSEEDFNRMLNLDAISNDPAADNARLNALDEKINANRAKYRELQTGIDQQASNYLSFIRENAGFETDNNAVAATRDYLIDDAATLSLEGNFNYSEENSSIKGAGKIVLEDSKHQIHYFANLLLGLGDLRFSASGLERDDLEYYVTLKEGAVKAPKKEGNAVKEVVFGFDRLDFEMGMGLIEQLEQQLQLDDVLTGGNVLGNINLG